MKELTQILRKEFKDKETAHIYTKEFLYENIATQIQVLREQRGLTQKELADKSGMKQSRISLLENPNYDKWSISTLTKLGEVFDVPLSLSFKSFTDTIDDIDNFSRESLERLSREDDLALEEQQESNSKALSSHLTLVVDNTFDTSSVVETDARISIAQSVREVKEFPQVAGY